MRRIWNPMAALALILALALFGAARAEGEGEEKPMRMNVQIQEYNFTAALADTRAAAELAEMLRQGPVALALEDYSGFEKVGPLGARLTASDARTTTEPGDIVLYNSANIVMFYGSNTWAYTRIGRVEDLTDWAAALGGGDVTAVLTLIEE